MTDLPVVLVTTDLRDFDGGPWHMTRSTYVDAVFHGAGALPLQVPNLEIGRAHV